MRYLLTLIIVIGSFLIIGCNENKVGMGSNQKSGLVSSGIPGITCDDIATAMDMNYCYVKMPDNIDNEKMVGFTYKSNDGIAPCGLMKFERNDVVKVLWWKQGEFLKCCLIGKTYSSHSEFQMKDLIKYDKIHSGPDKSKIYNANQIFSKWSGGNSLITTSDDQKLDSVDEIGFILVIK